MFIRAAPPGSRLLAASRAGSEQVRSWATVAPDHTIRIVLINASRTRARTALVHLSFRSRPAILERLEAPSAYATDGVTIAGQSFGAQTVTGALDGSARRSRIRADGDYRVKLPPASAAMLTIPNRG